VSKLPNLKRLKAFSYVFKFKSSRPVCLLLVSNFLYLIVYDIVERSHAVLLSKTNLEIVLRKLRKNPTK
jgi:hypothetical protein